MTPGSQGGLEPASNSIGNYRPEISQPASEGLAKRTRSRSVSLDTPATNGSALFGFPSPAGWLLTSPSVSTGLKQTVQSTPRYITRHKLQKQADQSGQRESHDDDHPEVEDSIEPPKAKRTKYNESAPHTPNPFGGEASHVLSPGGPDLGYFAPSPRQTADSQITVDASTQRDILGLLGALQQQVESLRSTQSPTSGLRSLHPTPATSPANSATTTPATSPKKLTTRFKRSAPRSPPTPEPNLIAPSIVFPGPLDDFGTSDFDGSMEDQSEEDMMDTDDGRTFLSLSLPTPSSDADEFFSSKPKKRVRCRATGVKDTRMLKHMWDLITRHNLWVGQLGLHVVPISVFGHYVPIFQGWRLLSDFCGRRLRIRGFENLTKFLPKPVAEKMNEANCWVLFNRRALANYTPIDSPNLSLFSPNQESNDCWYKNWSNDAKNEKLVANPEFLVEDIATIAEILERLATIEEEVAASTNTPCVHMATNHHIPPVAVNEKELEKANQMMVQSKPSERPPPLLPSARLASRTHASFLGVNPQPPALRLPVTPTPRPITPTIVPTPKHTPTTPPRHSPNEEEERSLLLAAFSNNSDQSDEGCSETMAVAKCFGRLLPYDLLNNEFKRLVQQFFEHVSPSKKKDELTVLVALTSIMNHHITVNHTEEDGSPLYTVKLEPSANLVAQVRSNEIFSSNPLFVRLTKWVASHHNTISITVFCVHTPDGDYRFFPS